MNILALDTGTKTGWALLYNGKIESGVQDFTKRRGESNGLMFLKFGVWLREFPLLIYPAYSGLDYEKAISCMPKPINVIAYELAHYRGGAATEICVNLTGRAQEFAASIGAECMGIHSNSLKKFCTGSGKASKEDMILWFIKATGRKPEDDNEADAYALLLYAMNELGEKTK